MSVKPVSEEEILVSESPEINVGENTRWLKRVAAAFPAFQSKNYRLYFSGQLVSLIGTWLQIVAQGWLVLTLTNSAFLIGLIAALGTLPSLLFTLFGGVLVDKFPKKTILLFTQISSMLLALFLGILTVTNIITIWQIGFISFLFGSVNAIDAPARQAFVSEIVNKEQLSSAIALNSGIFNAARVIGPSIAGFLIAVVGTGGAFIANSLSYLAVIAALITMNIDKAIAKKHIETISAIKDGLVYSFTHPIIATLIVFTGVSSVFGWSYTTLIPWIARNEYHLDATGLGYLYAATGLGSILATVVISAYAKKISPLFFIIGGNMLFAFSIILFTYTKSLHFALPLLFLVGFGLISQFSTMNTTIQRLVKDEYRGRVMSIYVLMFFGLTPLGNFQIGWLSENMGIDFAIRVGAVVVMIFGMSVFIYRKKIREAYKVYKRENMED